MKITLQEAEVRDYTKTVKIEDESGTYYAQIHWDYWDGYDVSFWDENQRPMTQPKWADEYIENAEATESLGFHLDNLCEEVRV